MNAYRNPPRPNVYVVVAQVRGPLDEFDMESVVEAWDPGDAIVRFVEATTEHGFDLLSEPHIVNLPNFSFSLPGLH